MLSLSVSAAQAQTEKKPERWFEVEVILFSQLADKTVTDEQFPNPEQVPLMRNRTRAIDILTPFLKPNLTAIKSGLNGCLTNHDNIEFVKPWQPAPLFELSEFLLNFPDFNTTNREQISRVPANSFVQESGFEAVISNSVTSEQTEQEAQAITNSFNQPAELTVTEPELLSPAEIDELITQVAFEIKQYDEVTQQATRLNSLYKIKNYRCLLPGEVFNWEQLLSPEQLTNYSNIASDDFDVISVPPRIQGSQPEWQRKPYLISSDALKLKKLAQRLRNSKNFRPLLHVGWRQVGLPKNQAIPVKLFAGDNLSLAYKHELQAAQKLKAQELAMEAELGFDLNNEVASKSISSKDKALGELFNEVNSSETLSTTALIKRLDENYVWPESPNDESLPLPTPPKQNWYLDGLFKVHLNHYLFITADFNIMEKPLSDINYNTIVDKQVRFVQNRRVISKEIHYFDHPYMGMIVQIRRYSHPEKENNNE